MKKAFQDFYAEKYSHCYGCGKNNPNGHQLKSYWDGKNTIARFTPKNEFSGGVPDHVYGGMIASLLDCHGTASAAAFAHQSLDREMGDQGEPIRYVTGSLKIDFLRPTPMGNELTIQGKLINLEGRKAFIELSLSANGIECAKAEMLAIQFKAS